MKGGSFQAPDSDLYCRESAATLRFLTAVAAAIPGRCRLTVAPSLKERPMLPLIEAMRQLDVDCRYDEKDGSVTVTGGFKSGVAELPGDISSQYVSALLMLSPLAEEGMQVKLTTALESQPFVLMTLECLLVNWDGICTITHSGSEIRYASCAVNHFYVLNYSADKKQSVFAHEVGHALGLADVYSGARLMHGITSERYDTYGVYRPQTDDIDGVNAMY